MSGDIKTETEAPLAVDLQRGVMWEVWMEGYACTGERNAARFMGMYLGATFEDACNVWAKEGDNEKYYKNNPPRYWGCKLFNNEMEARKNFG